MRAIFEQVIGRGGYDLTEMLRNIDLYHIEGKLTDEDREALYELARGGAKPVYDYSAEINAIWAAIRELQGHTPDPDEYPECVQPSGAHDAYNTGDGISYNGEKYKCKIDGCVWPPDVFPDAWGKVD